ncbi:hypothetical protein F4677DRAFT_421962 [Hypoxylon crocopeplum]|nr:hypothetical protein F4677DRAFT_421962 [Hypoxylon crocopeplum]
MMANQAHNDHPANNTPMDSMVVVDTNNFRQVLEEFDENGHLINPGTRFKIPCVICQEQNLAFLNSKFDKLSRDTYEDFAVLPICGHAFCFQCISHWLVTEEIRLRQEGRPVIPTCPSCRTEIYFDENKPLFLSILCTENVEKQAEDIVKIRNLIFDRDILDMDEEEIQQILAFDPRGLHFMSRDRFHPFSSPAEVMGAWQMLYPRPSRLTEIEGLVNGIDLHLNVPAEPENREDPLEEPPR